MDVDLDKMKTTNAKENKDEDSQESENEDSEAEEDENLEEAQKDHDRRADITIGSTSTCVQFMNPDEVAFPLLQARMLFQSLFLWIMILKFFHFQTYFQKVRVDMMLQHLEREIYVLGATSIKGH